MSATCCASIEEAYHISHILNLACTPTHNNAELPVKEMQMDITTSRMHDCTAFGKGSCLLLVVISHLFLLDKVGMLTFLQLISRVGS